MNSPFLTPPDDPGFDLEFLRLIKRQAPFTALKHKSNHAKISCVSWTYLQSE
jgi:hypothetical protein